MTIVGIASAGMRKTRTLGFWRMRVTSTLPTRKPLFGSRSKSSKIRMAGGKVGS